MFLIEWFEPLIIVAAISFLGLVIFLSFYLKKKGKAIMNDCSGSCDKCGGQCKVNLVKEYKKSKTLNRYEFYIEGMKCGMCEEHVCRVIRNSYDKAKKIKANHHKGILSFTYDGYLDAKKVKEDIEKLGYRVIGIVRK